MAPSPGDPAAGYMAIVRRGRGEVFLALDTCLAQPGVTVVWDRRGSERRRRSEPVSRDRRAGERRGMNLAGAPIMAEGDAVEGIAGALLDALPQHVSEAAG